MDPLDGRALEERQLAAGEAQAVLEISAELIARCRGGTRAQRRALYSGTVGARQRSKKTAREVAPFPPIPRPPKPPQLPVDPRQSRSAEVIGAIASVAQAEMHVAGPNLSTGFHASAVDVGRLQAALEHGLRRFDDVQLERRWDEIVDWIRRVTRSWVQRCKQMRIERQRAGIRIELETQDDLGYYKYEFDVFPRRRNETKKAT